MEKRRIILLRHGQSQWNKENRFTGWVDVPLTAEGEAEARQAARLISEAGLQPRKAYTSYLKRAIKTLWICLEELDLMHIPVLTSWRLNEKHYGQLTGLNKSETAARHGEEQVKLWRRAYDVAPPPLDPQSPYHPVNDLRYAEVPPHLLPATESLKNTIERLLPLWEHQMAPEIRNTPGDYFVVAHGNSLRGLIKFLMAWDEQRILEFNLPTGIPYVLELDAQMRVIYDSFLISQEELERKMAEVAAQGKQ
ncbi:MAG: 2,3-diphosphoglycerate-dependent phosphoglycerate mutase [Flavobacteriales bacterium]|nr:2,3-diphosphoglycerate-dependent phosphoglycerate mutase [Flavobacteriales bacterium]MCX7768004.1 2,3-diphosphoglycerate-dependent phosphoglycerate mutase [Flavobacteriales bacterium]MDW8409209.1 2,3-diphosphoglycerate-dependent phosphoglycerate mutase [Flavobacteriales bacterium]